MWPLNITVTTGNVVAILGLLVTFGGLVWAVAWAVGNKLAAGATRYIDTRVDHAAEALSHADDKLAQQLTHSINMLTAELRTVVQGRVESDARIAEQMTRMHYELSHTNDGSTVKGALTKLSHDAEKALDRVVHLEEEVQEVKEEQKRLHPPQVVNNITTPET